MNIMGVYIYSHNEYHVLLRIRILAINHSIDFTIGSRSKIFLNTSSRVRESPPMGKEKCFFELELELICWSCGCGGATASTHKPVFLIGNHITSNRARHSPGWQLKSRPRPRLHGQNLGFPWKEPGPWEEQSPPSPIPGKIWRCLRSVEFVIAALVLIQNIVQRFDELRLSGNILLSHNTR